MQQAQDFLEESEAIHALVAPLDEADFERPTGFKSWTINEILRHLHVWNIAADLSLVSDEKIQAFLKDAMASAGQGGIKQFENAYVDGMGGQALVAAWKDFYTEMAGRFAQADPKKRLQWAGPSMSARSSITARLMENWAHAQAIYDELGVPRQNSDRIQNIVVIGLNTYGWSHKVHGLEAPEPIPFLRLTAPSGAIWEFGEESAEERIEGLAEEFCQVVTQTRNIADTNLVVTGPNATKWMSIAQCFAGGAETPPPPGTRKRRQAG